MILKHKEYLLILEEIAQLAQEFQEYDIICSISKITATIISEIGEINQLTRQQDFIQWSSKNHYIGMCLQKGRSHPY
jgi:hypothetical protein